MVIAAYARAKPTGGHLSAEVLGLRRPLCLDLCIAPDYVRTRTSHVAFPQRRSESRIKTVTMRPTLMQSICKKNSNDLLQLLRPAASRDVGEPCITLG